MSYNILEIIFQLTIIVLILLGSVSFILFIRRLLINTSTQNTKTSSMEKKLDKIIELLEKKDSQ